ncbi:UDP-glucose/GDP-mannose dehydrogenase family protein [Pseudaminobacter arsenicus]|uniref:UDP-glucose 6-dehydrogenase n=1 Tax=Borborobacter arsenicus TaxID=1851146 RepID=A0A432V858_9HYPH|nr:UDP-glucose/GDP-mannose dehydrogenase family protein [Pseudaminobacter arsenicus]RUM98371.1 UDP-glucose/GDP-mannose dehydrogenase family protein [Pseudaminobacter arsenicus]
MKIAIIGTGYVGLVSAACLASWGHEVVGVDKDAAKIAALRQGVMPIYEPGLDVLMAQAVRQGLLSFTTDAAPAIAAADVVMIAVGTPPRLRDGEADLAFVYAAAKEVAASISGFTVVVVKSTVPIGTGDDIERIIGRVRPDAGFAVASNPEFLRQGSAVTDFQQPDRVVIGADDERAAGILQAMYEPLRLQGIPVVTTKRRTAELIKYAANAFLAVKISYINEMADLCESVGADVRDVALGMGLDRRIGASCLNAGPGYGGSCFPKDTLALLRTSQDHGVALRIIQESIVANDARKRRMALKVIDALGGHAEGRSVAILGLTFKPETDDMREAPSIPLIEALQRVGARIRAHDPQGMANARALLDEVEFFDDPYECAAGADIVVLMTDWRALKALDLGRLARVVKERVLVDFRHAFDPIEARRHGFVLSAIGVPQDKNTDISTGPTPAIRSARRHSPVMENR